MAEPPPKKIGSLRDRIAAFEHKGPAPAPTPAPVPRPKPGNVSWKPRPTSPPPAAAATTDEEHAEKKAAGMSAADAKESITKGGSLKERMAALQGRGAFGGIAPAAPPARPVSEKPKWKPPPVVSPPAEEAEEHAAHTPSEQPTSPPVDVTKAPEDEDSAHVQAAEGEAREEEAKEPDPEEEERQRRAAIAARMARLGGARVGMGAPPIFGKKPDIPSKKVSTPKLEEHKDEVKETASEETSPPGKPLSTL